MRSSTILLPPREKPRFPCPFRGIPAAALLFFSLAPLRAAVAGEGRAVARELPAANPALKKTGAGRKGKDRHSAAARPQKQGNARKEPTAGPKATPSALKPAPPPKSGSWTQAGSSILFFSAGNPAGELGTGAWETPLPGGLIERRRAAGGVSRDGRFAWHWVRLESVRRGRTDTVLSSTSSLTYYGTSGKALWSHEDADAAPDLDPALLSENGELVLVFSRRLGRWKLTVYSFTGNPLMELESGERLTHARIAPNGRFAFVVWGPQDKPLQAEFLDLELRRRREIPAEGLPLSDLRINDDGSVTAGRRTLLKLR